MVHTKRKRKFQIEEYDAHPAKRKPSPKMALDVEQDLSDTESTTSGGESDGKLSNAALSDSQSNKPDVLAFHEKNKPVIHSAKELPTAQELKVIFESSELYKSNAFKLQIDQLLPTVTPKSTSPSRSNLDAFLLSLHSTLTQSPVPSLLSQPSHPLTTASNLEKKGISVPFPARQPTKDTKWTFMYRNPEEITVVGSWANGIAVKGKDGVPYCVDLSVQMSSSTLQEKDYLNDRFFHKRALFLSSLAFVIQHHHKEDVDLNWDSPCGDARQACLILKPKKGGKNDWSKLNTVIKIMPTLPSESPIPGARLSPTASNLRIADSSSDNPTGNDPHPTPLYNHLLSLSYLPISHLLRTHSHSTSIPNFKDALKLLRVWANQRGFGSGTKCVLGFDNLGSWWGFLIGLVVDGEEPVEDKKEKGRKKGRRTLGRGLSSYQLFRGVLDFLANHDWTEPVYMKTTSGGHKFPPLSWLSASQAVFIDPSSTCNILANVPLGSLKLLSVEAHRTLIVLDAEKDPFWSVFGRDLREPTGRFDVLLRVSLEGLQLRKEDAYDILDRGSYIASAFSTLDRLLHRALGSRIKAVSLLLPSSTPRDLNQSQSCTPTTIEIGLLLNPSEAFRLIDKGPKVDDLQAAIDEWREFWGEKSELRRFSDGGILECVVWDVERPEEKVGIPARIVRFVLERWCGLRRVWDLQPSFHEFLYPTPYREVKRGESGWKAAMQVFDQLVKVIKSMELPLSLVSCLPTTPELRYASPLLPSSTPLSCFPALPQCAKFLPTYEAILQFEKSSRWPDDLGAIQKVKLAWFERVATELMDKLPECLATVTMDDGASPVEDSASLEVVLKEGWGFRLRIYHDRERTLLERVIEDKNLEPWRKHEAEKALSIHLMRFIHSPRHHASIMNIHHRYAGYSPTVRLLKRWFASHLLSSIPTELVELVCAYVFLRPDPQPVPHTSASGFARVMHFLASWEWRSEPLAIPLDAAAGVDEETTVAFPVELGPKVEEAFKARRAIDPAMTGGAWHISSEGNVSGVWWCLEGRGVPPMVAERVKRLAKACVGVLERGLNGPSVKTLFSHPMGDYDFLIHLDPKVLPRYIDNVNADAAVWSSEEKFVNVTSKDAEGILLDFDPAREFVNDLKRVYGDAIAFFFDELGGTVIAGSWNPLLREPKPFRALLGYSTVPDGGKKKAHVVLNEDSILAEIARMGQGMVKEIVKQTRSL